MKVADLTTGSGKLHHALKTLHAKWDQTRNGWHDPVSRRFENEYLALIEPQVSATLDRLAALAQVISAAEQACKSD